MRNSLKEFMIIILKNQNMEMEIIQSKNLKLLEKLTEIKFINISLFL